ncbi:hypothetical protein [Sphingomonas sp. PAMC 26617]|uniref:hypothetical protein n=1 Tax=Sphingomonas sp. PAMC 26617 TaxID=1112216 RepID=UPI001E5CBFDC|nr:hypothetical protein [Sphingomonas sp. PAMC 26617]
MRLVRGIYTVLILGLLFGTFGPHVALGRSSAVALAQASGWHWAVIPAGRFDLASAYSAGDQRAKVLTVYLEGDGLAYATPGQRAMDPTPTDPLALRMALQHPGRGAVAWLARPCQYVSRSRICRSDYWSIARFAPEVVAGTSAALDRMKAATDGATGLILVGYSGGGALAALLAERRDDVVALVTVAANLDLDAWVHDRGLTPLSRSLDPADGAARLAQVRQVHFVGSEDRVVGERVTRSFVARLPPGTPVSILVVPGQGHGADWGKRWPGLAIRPELLGIEGWR